MIHYIPVYAQCMTCAELHNVRLYFQNNTALEAGVALYGGSVDNCSLHFINSQASDYQAKHNCPKSGEVFDYITTSNQQSLDLSSDPRYICLCAGRKIDCSASSITRSVYPGGTIEVPIIAYGQRYGTTPAVIHVIHEHEIEVDNLENTQNIKNSCKLLRHLLRLFFIHTWNTPITCKLLCGAMMQTSDT